MRGRWENEDGERERKRGNEKEKRKVISSSHQFPPKTKVIANNAWGWCWAQQFTEFYYYYIPMYIIKSSTSPDKKEKNKEDEKNIG